MTAAYSCRNCGGIAPLAIHLNLMMNGNYYNYCVHCERYNEFKKCYADWKTIVKWRG